MASSGDNNQELQELSVPGTAANEESSKSSNPPKSAGLGESHETGAVDQVHSEKQDHTVQNQDVEIRAKVTLVPTSLSSVDILALKDKFLEIVEETRILRATDSENEQRIKELVAEKHDMERKMEDAAAASESKTEQHTRDIAEVKKQMEERINKLESEKHQTTIKTDIWEKEAKALKEDLRNLLVTRYSLEKSVKEQEHRIQMQSSTNESHMTQMKDLEGRCKDVLEDCSKFREQLAMLDTEVKYATEMNKKLNRVNTHQKCIIASLTEENEQKQAQLVRIKAASNGKQYEESATLSEKNSMIHQLKEAVANMKKINQHQEDHIKLIQDEQQKTLTALSESHLLVDRHLNNSLHSAKEVGHMKTQLEKTRNDLDSTQGQLASSLSEFEALKIDREKAVAELQNENTEVADKLKKLQGGNSDLTKAYNNLEELNSSWAKKNIDLNATVKKLKEELKEKETQLQESQLQVTRPETRDISTTTDMISTNVNEQKESAASESEKIQVDMVEPENSVAPDKEATSNTEYIVDANKSALQAASSESSELTNDVPLTSGIMESRVHTVDSTEQHDKVESDKEMGENIGSGSCSNDVHSLITLNKKSSDENSDVTELESSNVAMMQSNINLEEAQATSRTKIANEASQSAQMSSEIEMGQENQTPISDTLTTITRPLHTVNVDSGSVGKPEDEGQEDLHSAQVGAPQTVAVVKKSTLTSATLVDATSFPQDPVTVTPSKSLMSSGYIKQDSDSLNIIAGGDYITDTRFKGLSHLKSPPLISLPVLRQDITQKENRLSFTLPSLGSNREATNHKGSASSTISQHEIASTRFETMSKTFGIQNLPWLGSNPASSIGKELPRDTTYAERQNTMSQSPYGILTPKMTYTSKWTATAGGDQPDPVPPRKGNSQEEWPDFAGEFSADSNPEHSLTVDSSVTRQDKKKRPAEGTALFSDDEDDDDLKAGVSSQIERIQVFLKNDRLKRPKKNNKDQVV